LPLLGWTPVVFNLLYGVAVYLIAENTTSDRRAAWLAVWLFYPANWVGQDYFAPQAMTYLFYLTIVVVLLLWFRPSPLQRERWLRYQRWWRLRHAAAPLLRAVRLPPRPLQHEPRQFQLLPGQRIGLIIALMAIFVASIVSHQLTPPTMIVSVAMLVAVRRCSVRQLLILLAVIVAAYINYLTVAYWSGHLSDLLGSLGHVGKTVRSSTTNRVQGDAAHQLVSRGRLGLTFVIWCIAGAGAWRRMRRGAGDLALLALAVAPFLVILLQSYGGEVLLRIYLFVLPATAVLIAGALLPAGEPRRRGLTAAAAGVLTVVLIATFYVTRYGNESFRAGAPGGRRCGQLALSRGTAGIHPGGHHLERAMAVRQGRAVQVHAAHRRSRTPRAQRHRAGDGGQPSRRLPHHEQRPEDVCGVVLRASGRLGRSSRTANPPLASFPSRVPQRGGEHLRAHTTTEGGVRLSNLPERSDDPLDEGAARGRIMWAADHNVGLDQEHAQPVGWAAGGDGDDGRWPAVLLLLINVVVLALVITRAPAALQAAPVIAYVITVPGLACVRLARLPDRLAEGALAVGLSIALGTLVAQAMVYLRAWSPTLGIVILTVIASIASCAELIGVGRSLRAFAPPDGGQAG
jgi:hypothetical protein